jgi:hypothetical protein
MERDKKSGYWTLLESIATTTSERTQRRIACSFCRLVWSALPVEGKEALVVAEKYAEGEIDLKTCERYQKLLQRMLPGRGQSVPISAVLWALTESSPEYPAWYSAALAASNLVELNAATEERLCSIVRKFVNEERHI